MCSKHKNNKKKTPSISAVLALIALAAAFMLIPSWVWMLMIIGCLLARAWKKKSK